MSLGIRCTPTEIVVAQATGTRGAPEVKLESVQTLRLPSGKPAAKQLKWCLDEVVGIVSAQKPAALAIKIEERTASSDRRRVRLEAAAEIAAATCNIEVVTLVKTQLKSRLGFQEPARYGGRALAGLGLPQFSRRPAAVKEAVLAACAALPECPPVSRTVCDGLRPAETAAREIPSG